MRVMALLLTTALDRLIAKEVYHLVTVSQLIALESPGHTSGLRLALDR